MALEKLSIVPVSGNWNLAKRIGTLWFPVLSGCAESRILQSRSRDLLSALAFCISTPGSGRPTMLNVRAALDAELANPGQLSGKLQAHADARVRAAGADLEAGRHSLFGDPAPMLDLHLTASRAGKLTARWHGLIVMAALPAVTCIASPSQAFTVGDLSDQGNSEQGMGLLR